MFYRWATTVNETRNIKNLPEQDWLAKRLSHFLLNVRKQNGDEYERINIYVTEFRPFVKGKTDRNSTVYLLTDSLQRPEKPCLVNENNFAVLAKGRRQTKRKD